MHTDRLLRATLRLSLFFNLGAAALLVFPASPVARFAGFTVSTSPMHTGIAALMVAALGVAYGWLARQAVIDLPMLTLGASIKALAFFLLLALWLCDAGTMRIVLFSTVDLVFAAVWLDWARRNRAGPCRGASGTN